jgi:hypothetical protein
MYRQVDRYRRIHRREKLDLKRLKIYGDVQKSEQIQTDTQPDSMAAISKLSFPVFHISGVQT